MGQKQSLDTLLEAARLLAHTGVLIALAGDGNDRARLVTKARDLKLTNVRFTGVQPSGIHESMLSAADVLLLNQRHSVSDMALPSKLSSYFAAGRPVVAAVASNSEAAREVVAAKAGALVLPGDAEGLARTLLAIRENPSQAAEYGRNAVAFARSELTEKAAMCHYWQFLDRDCDHAGLSLPP